MSVSSPIGQSRHPRACVALVCCHTLTCCNKHFGNMFAEMISRETKTFGLGRVQNCLFVVEHGGSVANGCGRSEE
jgi:hypothetical protein